MEINLPQQSSMDTMGYRMAPGGRLQWGNRLRILAKAKKKMDENEDAAKVLPPGFFLPFLEAAGNVEDEDVEELWANLLANSLSIPDAQHPMVLNVLKQLSGQDAQQLRALLKREDGEVRQKHGITPLLVNELNATIARLLALGLVYKTPVFVGPAPPKGGEASIVVSGFGRVFLSVVETARRNPVDGAVSAEAELDA